MEYLYQNEKNYFCFIIGLILNSCLQNKRFTCDDPELKKLISEKVGVVQNVKTTYYDEETQTCICEGYAPDIFYRSGYSVARFGVSIEYKAQRLENGEIEVEIIYNP